MVLFVIWAVSICWSASVVVALQVMCNYIKMLVCVLSFQGKHRMVPRALMYLDDVVVFAHTSISQGILWSLSLSDLFLFLYNLEHLMMWEFGSPYFYVTV
jgi:hypothetical protein